MVLNGAISIAIIAVLCECVCAQTQYSKVVQLRQGPVRGYQESPGTAFSFFSIPYATAPSGRDRFKAPLPPPTWTAIRDAVNQQIVCPQLLSDVFVSQMQSPDCLLANVHTPDTNATNLPVMVIVHGGGFNSGHGSAQTINSLAQSKNIVGVTFNYRLNTYGFLCLGTETAPGNAGMKDMVALLRWVRDNIASFGGNPNDVTIDGCSAGGAAVDLLLMSKATEGLFNKAISASGSNLAVWAVQVDPIENAKMIARYHNVSNVDDIEALEEFFTTAPFETLVDYPLTLDQNLLVVPCIERDIGQEIFLHDAPINIIKSRDYRQVPMLYGATDLEGLFILLLYYEKYTNAMNENFADVLPHDLQFQSEAEKQQVARRVREFYFGDKVVGSDNTTLRGFMDYYTDIMFTYPILRSTKLQVEAGNNQIYLYDFMFAGRNTTGAIHCLQTMLVYDSILATFIPSYREMSAILRDIWSNFITTGTPVPAGSSLPAWPPVTAARSPHMVLTLQPELRGQLLPERSRLWDDIYDKHFRIQRPPNPTAPPTPPPQPGSASTVDKNMKIISIAVSIALLCFK